MATSSMPGADVRIDSQFMFSDHKNVHKPRLEKRQRKLLQKIPFMNAFLEADEKVLLVAPCVSPTSIWEQLTTGWVFAYLNRALFVVTNKGIFHLPSKMDYGYRHSIAKFRYTDCKRLEGGRHIFVQYGNGKKERFLYVQRQDRKKLKEYFKSLNVGTRPAANAGRTHLCPRCTTPLVPNVYQCGSCRLTFKDMATAKKASLVIPGGGYFYTGHPILGIGDFLVELYLLAIALISLLGALGGEEAGYFGAGFFGILLVLEKLITLHHAKRYVSEYIPKEKDIRLQPAAARPAMRAAG